MGDGLTLEFSREVLIIDGFPILGVVEVEAELDDGQVYFEVTAFEPEKPVSGLVWAAIEAPGNDWLTEHWDQVWEKAFKRS